MYWDDDVGTFQSIEQNLALPKRLSFENLFLSLLLFSLIKVHSIWVGAFGARRKLSRATSASCVSLRRSQWCGRLVQRAPSVRRRFCIRFGSALSFLSSRVLFTGVGTAAVQTAPFRAATSEEELQACPKDSSYKRPVKNEYRWTGNGGGNFDQIAGAELSQKAKGLVVNLSLE